MTNSIDIFIYSYKGKNIKSVIENLIKNKSEDSTVQVLLGDQHPLNREEMFKEIKEVYYHHIFWDWLTNQCEHKYTFIQRSKAKYTMFLNDNVILKKDWDKDLISFVEKNNCVISGHGKINIKSKNIFYIKKDIEDSDSFVLNNFVDRSLIFAETKTLKDIIYPRYIKYNGEEEHLSLALFCKGVDIYGSPSNMYNCIDEVAIDTLYVPFSKDHNYNEVVDLLEYGKNKYHSVLNGKRSLEDFIDFHDFNFKKIKKLPYEKNDVRYDPEALQMNKVDARRFVNRTREIS